MGTAASPLGIRASGDTCASLHIVRLRLAEKTLEEDLGSAIDDLNAQIRTNREALNADLPVIDRQAALNEAKDRLARQSLDKSALENANKRIEDFDTNVQLQLKSRELGAENIYNVMQDFQDDLEDHKDNMQVMAKVQILEEYRNLIDKFVESIKRQNEAKEQQTHTAALSAGYIEHGSQYIKKGQGSTNLGFVDAIRHYDIESEADNFKQTSQIFASEEQFNRLMEQSSMPEFQAILHVEKLKVQKWMESISGTAQDPATRARTNDPDKLGEFGMWIGRGPDGHHASLLEHGAGKGSAELYGGAYINLAAQSMSDGLGQMGAAHSRPGMPGFYLQLSFYNQMVAERNAKEIANAGGTIDPVSGLLNTFNPVSILATAVHNVEVGSRVHGHDRGNLIGANIAAPVAEAMKTAGPVIAAALSWTGVGIAIGAAVTAIGHSIRANPTTGEMGMDTSDQMAINTVFSMLPGAGPGASLGTRLATTVATSVAQSSLQYDETGDLKGFAVPQGREGSAMMLRTAFSAGATGFAGSDFGKDLGLSNTGVSGVFTSQTGTVFGEYAVRQMVGRDYSNYEAVTTPSMAILGRMAGQSLGEWAGSELAGTEAIGTYLENEKLERLARSANKHGQKRSAVEVLQGLGIRRREESAWVSALDSVGDAFSAVMHGSQIPINIAASLLKGTVQGSYNLARHGSLLSPEQQAAQAERMKELLISRIAPPALGIGLPGASPQELAKFAAEAQKRAKSKKSQGPKPKKRIQARESATERVPLDLQQHLEAALTDAGIPLETEEQRQLANEVFEANGMGRPFDEKQGKQITLPTGRAANLFYSMVAAQASPPQAKGVELSMDPRTLGRMQHDRSVYGSGGFGADQKDQQIRYGRQLTREKIEETLAAEKAREAAERLEQSPPVMERIKKLFQRELSEKEKALKRRADAIEFLKQNRLAYEAGFQPENGWLGYPRGQDPYLPVTGHPTLRSRYYVNADGKYYEVIRDLPKHGAWIVSEQREISRGKYLSHSGGNKNYTNCNVAASVIGLAHGAPNLWYNDAGQFKTGKMQRRLQNGAYNTNTHEFAKVDFQKAEEWAREGGFSFAMGPTHIAALVGGYDGKESQLNLRIFQAGAEFGRMRLGRGWGESIPEGLEYYIWKEK